MLIRADGYKAPPFIETTRDCELSNVFENDLEGRVVKKIPKKEGNVGEKGMLRALEYFDSLQLFSRGDICTSIVISYYNYLNY